jgi:hypothetical protein
MIFVSIAAYREPELSLTLDSLVNNSSEQLHISLVEQCTPNRKINVNKWESDRVKFTREWMHPKDAKGAGYARHLALQNYNNEDYILQIDSHTDMVQNWDLKLITALNSACELAGNDKVILSQFPGGYELEGWQRVYLYNHHKYTSDPTCTKPKLSKRGLIAPARVAKTHDGLEPSTMVLAGYIFAKGEFSSLGYDKNITFWGEEFMTAITAWIAGWRIYSPDEMYIWHHYGRPHHDKPWKDVDNWGELDERSLQYQEDYFINLKQTNDWQLLHDDHRNVIDQYLKSRGSQRGQVITEQELTIDMLTK